MDNQTEPNGLWERKTFLSTIISALLAGAVAVSVCAFRGETLALGHAPTTAVSQTRTDSSTGLCLAGGK
jgi:hypothetical protein